MCLHNTKAETPAKIPYDQFIGMLVANAVKTIEAETGRKVVELSFPPPRSYDSPDNRRGIYVQFAEEAEAG